MKPEHYEALRPYFDVIRTYGKSLVLVSNAHTDSIHEVYKQMGNSPIAGWCGACVGQMYQWMYNALIKYQKDNGVNDYNFY